MLCDVFYFFTDDSLKGICRTAGRSAILHFDGSLHRAGHMRRERTGTEESGKYY